jgi:hypothetical protein
VRSSEDCRRLTRLAVSLGRKRDAAAAADDKGEEGGTTAAAEEGANDKNSPAISLSSITSVVDSDALKGILAKLSSAHDAAVLVREILLGSPAVSR